ncbi:unnamed protein product, partial [Musa acuminata subsp. burmannicoides]
MIYHDPLTLYRIQRLMKCREDSKCCFSFCFLGTMFTFRICEDIVMECEMPNKTL